MGSSAEPVHGPGSRPSDAGLAGERTMLSWARVGIGLLGLPMAILGYSAGRSALAAVASAFAAVLGLGVLTLSVRRQRVVPRAIEQGQVAPAAGQIVGTAGCLLFLSLACLVLVLR